MGTKRIPHLLGVRTSDLRAVFRDPAGHRRGFYARWRPSLRAWECQLSGFGMRPRRWFAPSQSVALCDLRLIPCLWSYRCETRDLYATCWDGIPDTVRVAPRHGYQPDLFAGASA